MQYENVIEKKSTHFSLFHKEEPQTKEAARENSKAKKNSTR
jgi:hypothetical protein